VVTNHADTEHMFSRKTGDDAVRSNATPKHRARRGGRKDLLGDLLAGLTADGYHYHADLALGEDRVSVAVGPTGAFAMWTVDESGKYRVGDDRRLMRGRHNAGDIVARGGRVGFELRNLLQDAGAPMHVRCVAVVTKGKVGFTPLDLGDVVVVEPTQLMFVVQWGPGPENYPADEIERAAASLTEPLVFGAEPFEDAADDEDGTHVLADPAASAPVTTQTGVFEVPMPEEPSAPLFAGVAEAGSETETETPEQATETEAPAADDVASEPESEPEPSVTEPQMTTNETAPSEADAEPEAAAAAEAEAKPVEATRSPFETMEVPVAEESPLAMAAVPAPNPSVSDVGYELFRQNLAATATHPTPPATPTPFVFPDPPMTTAVLRQEGERLEPDEELTPYEAGNELFGPPIALAVPAQGEDEVADATSEAPEAPEASVAAAEPQPLAEASPETATDDTTVGPYVALRNAVAGGRTEQEGYRRYEMVVDDLSAANPTAQPDEGHRSYEIAVDDEAYQAADESYRTNETPVDATAFDADPDTDKDTPMADEPSSHELSSYESFVADDGQESRHAEPFDAAVAKASAELGSVPFEAPAEYGRPFDSFRPLEPHPSSTAMLESAFASNSQASRYEMPTEAVPVTTASEGSADHAAADTEHLSPFFSDEYNGPTDRFSVDESAAPVDHAPIPPMKPVDYAQRLKDASTWSYHGRRLMRRK